jgi:hypothetical protein
MIHIGWFPSLINETTNQLGDMAAKKEEKKNKTWFLHLDSASSRESRRQDSAKSPSGRLWYSPADPLLPHPLPHARRRLPSRRALLCTAAAAFPRASRRCRFSPRFSSACPQAPLLSLSCYVGTQAPLAAESPCCYARFSLLLSRLISVLIPVLAAACCKISLLLWCWPSNPSQRAPDTKSFGDNPFSDSDSMLTAGWVICC